MTLQHSLQLAEYGTRARHEAAQPASARPHVWVAGVCSRRTCGMRETWPGAQYACSGMDRQGGGKVGWRANRATLAAGRQNL